MLSWFRNYLVIVSDGKKKINTITIYDTKNKFIAFAAGFEDVTHIMNEWGGLYLLQGDGKV